MNAGSWYRGTFVNSFRPWIMAFVGSPLRTRPNFYSGRFLLLLCQEVGYKLFISLKWFLHVWLSFKVTIFIFWFQKHSSLSKKYLLYLKLSQTYDISKSNNKDHHFFSSSLCSLLGGHLVLRLPSGVVWLARLNRWTILHPQTFSSRDMTILQAVMGWWRYVALWHS